ncbi:hypothetical protein [Bacillus cereus]|nr:hypothetical protein [Bacillus cereus]
MGTRIKLTARSISSLNVGCASFISLNLALPFGRLNTLANSAFVTA